MQAYNNYNKILIKMCHDSIIERSSICFLNKNISYVINLQLFKNNIIFGNKERISFYFHQSNFRNVPHSLLSKTNK